MISSRKTKVCLQTEDLQQQQQQQNETRRRSMGTNTEACMFKYRS